MRRFDPDTVHNGNNFLFDQRGGLKYSYIGFTSTFSVWVRVRTILVLNEMNLEA